MARLWFKRHRYGYGWTPATWQAWIALAAAAAVLIGTVALTAAWAPQDAIWPVVLDLVVVLAVVAALVRVSIAKGPTPRWRWGRRPDDDPDQDF